MGEHDELYGRAREAHLVALLRHLAERIHECALSHFEVRCTYDTPELADSRRIVEQARRDSYTPEPPEDEEPWRSPAAD